MKLTAEYTTRHKYRGWNTKPTFLEEPRLASVVFPEATKADHERLALAFANDAKKLRDAWLRAVEAAEKKYGSHGSLISGGTREHWPPKTRERIGEQARQQSYLRSAAEAHWKAAGKRSAPPWRNAS